MARAGGASRNARALDYAEAGLQGAERNRQEPEKQEAQAAGPAHQQHLLAEPLDFEQTKK